MSPAMRQEPPVMQVTNLRIRFPSANGLVHAVRGCDMDLYRGQTVGVVGESGAGKTAMATAFLGLHDPRVEVEGSVLICGTDMSSATEAEWSRVRGAQISMVFQDPRSALTPVYTVTEHITEAVLAHSPSESVTARRNRAEELLRLVGFDDPRRVAGSYPFELSGGMLQRVMIAIAIVNEPAIIVADEPTTALDATIQAQVLHALQSAQDAVNAGLLLVTHDLGVIARMADDVMVMQDGRCIERGPVDTVYAHPTTEHTRRMLAKSPRLYATRAIRPRSESEPVISVRGVKRHFPVTTGSLWRRRTGTVRAVDGVDLFVFPSETLGLVGESGSGKTTLLREILELRAPEEGTIAVLGYDVSTVTKSTRKHLRGELQVVFQDPLSSLDPRMPVFDILSESLGAQRMSASSKRDRVIELLEMVGLDETYARRYPRQLSGGQGQRVAIARAIAVEPSVIVLDEPVSALDASIQADIIELLEQLQQRLGLSYLFVSHDLAVIASIADRVAVMFRGRIVEEGFTRDVYDHPRHPYTAALLSAVPIPDPRAERERQLIVLPDTTRQQSTPSKGCTFRLRCPLFARLSPEQQQLCTDESPTLQEMSTREQKSACHHHAELQNPQKTLL